MHIATVVTQGSLNSRLLLQNVCVCARARACGSSSPIVDSHVAFVLLRTHAPCVCWCGGKKRSEECFVALNFVLPMKGASLTPAILGGYWASFMRRLSLALLQQCTLDALLGFCHLEAELIVFLLTGGTGKTAAAGESHTGGFRQCKDRQE